MLSHAGAIIRRYLTSCLAVEQCFYIPVFALFLYFMKGKLSAQLHGPSHAMTLGLHRCIELARRLLLSCNMRALAELGPSWDRYATRVTFCKNIMRSG